MFISMVMDRYKHSYFFKNSLNPVADYQQTNFFVNSGCLAGFPLPATKWRHKTAPWTSCAIKVDDQQTFRVGYGYTPNGQSAVFEFNPGKLDDHATTALGVCVQQCIYAEMPGFLEYGHVGSVEVAIDVAGSDYFDYEYVDLKLRSHDDHYAKDGTTYLGSESSARSLKCYSKSKELLETKGIAASSPALRIEATLIPSVRTILQDLPLVSNPFEPLLVLEKKRLHTYKDSVEVIKFTRALADGLCAPDAYRMFAPKDLSRRKVFVSQLVHCAPVWWKPKEIWAEHAPRLLDWLQPLVKPYCAK